jgi:hypothetical protein
MSKPRLNGRTIRLAEILETEDADILAPGGSEGAQRERIVERGQGFRERRDRKAFHVEHRRARCHYSVARRFRHIQQDRDRKIALAPRHGAKHAIVGQIGGA